MLCRQKDGIQEAEIKRIAATVLFSKLVTSVQTTGSNQLYAVFRNTYMALFHPTEKALKSSSGLKVKTFGHKIGVSDKDPVKLE